MSVKGADERTEKSGKGKGSAGGVERRAPRVHFEALVAVGEAEGDGGFDAESVDVSREGMRLRAEHLPNVGDKLLCRFDGGAGEIVVEAEVSWRSPEARGGEFGLKFLDVTPEDAEALAAMCASLGLDEGEGDEADVKVARGARVRLHIEGLGSPMKARVRESGGRDVEVGSNLEFLKVGRPLELEDAEAGKRTEAFIDSVKVEVDPETRVPQLVVSLRYDKEPLPKTERSTAKGQGAVTARDADGEELDVRDGDGRSADARAKLGEAGLKAKAAGAAALSKVGPAAALVSEKAKGAMSSLLSAIKSKRAAQASDEPERRAGPRRVTAPPPSGVLKADGKRLVREDGGDDMPMSEAPQKKNRKALFVGGLVGLLAVAGIVGATKLRSAPAPVAALPQSTAVASGDPLSANVPMFGATPMSTTETVPTALPTAQPEAAAAPKGAAKADADEDGELKKEWGEGSVKNPLVLKLKLDGEADGFHASNGDNGFTLEVPGRKFLGNASELAKKDKRIGSINVTNNPEGAEIVVQFKDTPPAYVARVKGERVEIALGRDKKVAKKGDKAGKKGDKGAKKKAAKKK